MIGHSINPHDGSLPRRADAQRNRDRLIEVARVNFTASPSPVPLDHIARQAEVGIGTLYRHFPTRESLVEAVYAAELDELTAMAEVLLKSLAPDDALRAWASKYSAFIVGKKGMLESLRAGWAAGRTVTTHLRINSAISPILEAGVQAGVLRADVSAEDVATLLLGVTTMSNDNSGQLERLLDFVVDALRAR